EIFDIPDETAIQFAKFVMGYPYAFQLLGSLLWAEGKRSIDKEITEKLDALLYDGSYQAIWNHMTKKEKKVLCAIAHSSTGTVKEIRGLLEMETNQFSPYRESLKESGLINTDSYGSITFLLPRFKEFVLKAELFYS
ncbi:MAG: ATP-binding protein, partial [Lachnospiraceae bacterium]|nr:ATP-binding protein [Lachnospiraceae bacterium]